MKRFGKIVKVCFWPSAAVFLAVSMAIYPQETFNAARRGLGAWWEIVFPALLPFFIISEIMIAFGVVRLLSVLLEPVMRPVFKLPGVASFVMAVGYTSGFPIGAVLTARLRRDGLCTRLEGERLLAFTNNASPLFMFGAVAVGMFGNPRLGVLIAVAHYSANLLWGLLLRFWGRRDPERPEFTRPAPLTLRRAWQALQEGRDRRPLGQILGDAVRNSNNTLMSIGGFIIFFAVLLQILNTTGLLEGLNYLVFGLLKLLGLSGNLVPAMTTGFFEITLGSRLASQAVTVLPEQVMVVLLILGWSGLSVHAQVLSVITGSGLRINLYLLGRIFQAGISLMLFRLLLSFKPIFASLAWPTSISPNNVLLYSPWKAGWDAAAWCLLLLLLSASGVVIINLFRRRPAILIWWNGKNKSI